LRAAIDQKVAVLVVIDPLMAYLNAEVNSHRDQDVRGALVHVKELAESKNCAILLVRHLNKSGGGNPLYRGGGSIGIIAAARSGLLIAEDPDDQKARVFAPTKANLSRLSPALSYIVSVTESGVPHIRWTGSSPHTAASLVTSSMEAGDRSAITGAKDFLYDVLGAGAQPAMEVEKDATEAGISKATLRRARSALKIKASKRGKPGTDGQHWVWELPEGDQRAESDGLALEDAHADERLREPEDAQPVRFERLREEPPSESSSYQIGNAPERASHEDAHADERLREEQPPAPEGAQVQEGQGSSGIGAREEYTV